MKQSFQTRCAVLIAACSLGAAAFASAGEPQAPAATPKPPSEAAFFSIRGYLPAGSMPDSLLLNPPPPALGSAAQARDEEAAAAALALQGSPRWKLAAADNDASDPGRAFSCAAGITIDDRTTPKLMTLLRRVARDLAVSTNPTKERYQRPRPFMVNGRPICTPELEQRLRGNGSYPPGHSAIGYGWGLVLAQVVPQRAAQLVARGRAFGDSRRVCNVHWLSDTEEGRVVAAAVVARMNAEPDFQTDLAAARQEVAEVAATAAPSACGEEAAALAQAQ